MPDLEDKYSKFFRNTNIDLQAEIASGGTGGLDNYYTKAQSDSITDALDVRIIALEETPSGVTDHGALTGITDDDHTQYHNDARGDIRYYTKSQIDASLASKSDTTHNHDSRYYTESETDSLLANKADATHTHAATDINSGTLDIARIPTGSTGTTVSLGNHTHDDRYYTESETNTFLNNKANISDTPRYLMFNTTWPARPVDSRMTFYIGGDPNTNAPTDSIAGDVWIPTPGA